MIQVYVPNVSSVSDVCCMRYHLDVVYTCMLHAYVKCFQVFHTSVASVVSGRCICLQWFSIVFRVFFASVLDTCFKCFICLLLYVAIIVSGCFKSRSSVAHRMRVGSG
jgi:hypothetical protein